jgi:ribosomal protein S18 acetylase RimI-like enzyme
MTTEGFRKNIFPPPPSIAGLTLHLYTGDNDYHDLVALLDQLRQLGLHEYGLDFNYFKNTYAHLTNCDLPKDFLLAKINDEPVGYIRHWWENVLSDHSRVHYVTFWMLPDWVDSPLGDFMIQFAEARTAEVLGDLPPVEGGDHIDFETKEEEHAKLVLFEKHGYKVIRYYYDMSRSLEGDLPDQPLPEGLEVRAVLKSQVRQVWEASAEAFKDEWGATENTEESFQSLMSQPVVRPELWQVAWDGDEVAGSVMNFIDLIENDQQKRHRGYTEGISVRRPYRGKGLASALICRSMRMFKALNMTEVALGVDTESPTGALGLYSRLGYKPYRTELVHSKSIKRHSE